MSKREKIRRKCLSLLIQHSIKWRSRYSQVIQPGIVGAFHSGPLVGRNDRLTAVFLKRRDESCGRIAAIGDHPREGEALQQRLRLSTIVALACR